jgi:hypothetical protein
MGLFSLVFWFYGVFFDRPTDEVVLILLDDKGSNHVAVSAVSKLATTT